MSEICPFFGLCGGCESHDIPIDEYLKMKMNKIKEALAHKAIQCHINPIISIPDKTRRRVTFTYNSHCFGFNKKKSHQLIDITQCRLLVPELEDLILPLKELSQKIGNSGKVSVLMTDIGADISFSMAPQKDKKKKKKFLDVNTLEEISFFCQKNPVVRFVFNGEIIFQAVQLSTPSHVFLQPSVMGEETLVRLVLENLKNAHKVFDLFCGLGTFTIPIHQAGIKVKGFDITTETIAFLQRKGISAEVRDLFRNPLSIEELNAADTIVLDPARSGAHALCQNLALSNVPKIVMVSCNPSTFARDARTLINGGYRLVQITPVDQFIFSSHLELVGIFEK